MLATVRCEPMSKYEGRKNYRHDQKQKVGILLTNLGTPDSPTPSGLRKYLGQFLSDSRVIEIPKPLWWLILHLVILRVRPRKSAAVYKKIWMAEGSPLLVYTQQQGEALQNLLDEHYPQTCHVEVGMRYGNPSIGVAINRLIEANVTHLLVLPLYPQYSGTTTASTFDEVSSVLGRMRWIPELHFVGQYADHPEYIAACAQQVASHREEHGEADQLLFSFHGLPKRNLLEGDPYHCQCHLSARLIAERLHLDENQWAISFQSRFGKQEWLKPYTQDTLSSMPKSGVKSVQVFCPGFPADCVETLEEIDMENRQYFLDAGGEDFQYIPALNTNREHIAALYSLVLKHAGQWPQFAVAKQAELTAQQLADSKARAMKLGAEH